MKQYLDLLQYILDNGVDKSGSDWDGDEERVWTSNAF